MEDRMNRSALQTRPPGADVEEELRQRLEALRAMPVRELQDTYYDAYGKATNARNREWLIRRCFFRAQEVATGVALSDDARARIAALAEGQGVRTRPATAPALPPAPDPDEPPRDPRLPPVGTVIHREHDGVVHEIRVLKDGFEYQGRHYTSLSTIAREVTGTSWNGFLWAGLTTRKKRARTSGGEG
jgi:hypothetical protein